MTFQTEYYNEIFDHKGIERSTFPYSAMRVAIQQRTIDILIFCIPALKFFEIEIIGRLFATEIILLTLFPFLLILKYKRLKRWVVIVIISLGFLWLSNQILTDLVRDISSVDYYRGWAKICFTIIHFTTLYLIINNDKKRIFIFLLGLCLGDYLEFNFNPNIYAMDYPWKFGVGNPLTLLTIVIASWIYKKSFIICIILFAFACSLNLYMDFRSLSGVCFLATICLSIKHFMKFNKYKIRLSPKQLISLSSLLILSCIVFLNGYEQLAKQGFLGEIAQRKYIWQSSGDLGILVGGRGEILVASRAILNSPIIGYGSWAKDYHFIDLLNNLMRSMGYTQQYTNELELIPSHSHFFGAWVEAGIFGALFWGFILAIIARAMTLKYRVTSNFFPLIIFISFQLAWDIIFSPFGADQRFTTPFFIIMIISFLPEKINSN
jgi:hypothetical protein